MFGRDHWYVIAESSELAQAPIGRKVCGDAVALYRTAGGQAAALVDRCPHRGYPLSRASVRGDLLVCGYHGFTFTCEGECVGVPGQDRVPPGSALRTYPLVERGPWVWVWMGDPAAPDYDRLPDAPWFESPDWEVGFGHATLAAGHRLVIDNLLDLSHETFLHPGSIGTPEIAETPITSEVDKDAGGVGAVRISRRMSAVECPSFYERSTGLTSPIDRWQDIHFSPPGFYGLHIRVAPAEGMQPPAGQSARPSHLKILFGVTPADETSTHTFWAIARDFALGDEHIGRELCTMQDEILGQDIEALELLQEWSLRGPSGPEVSIKNDRGALAARRLLDRLEGGREHESRTTTASGLPA